MELHTLGQSKVIRSSADVAVARERVRARPHPPPQHLVARRHVGGLPAVYGQPRDTRTAVVPRLDGGIPVRSVDHGRADGRDPRPDARGRPLAPLIQLQSFDTPTSADRIKGWFVDQVNRWLPASSQLRKPAAEPANILVIGATNRAADLDPALVRPGRFDRTITFDLPNRRGRREILDYYLTKKSHDAELDEPAKRETLAAMTFGYSPVMLEHLLDEALIWALRRGADRLGWNDIQQARMTEELGLKQPVEYAEDERRTIATHEAGHAIVAHLVGKSRKLEVLSIIKRGQALGLLAHSDLEERFTNTKTEIEARIQISFGGMVAEELFFGESGTGPAGDLQSAIAAAAQMVGAFGMAGSLISYDLMAGPPGAGIVAKVLSSEEGKDAVKEILERSKGQVDALLRQNRHLIEGLRDALLERDELVGQEILDAIREAEQGVLGPQVPLG